MGDDWDKMRKFYVDMQIIGGGIAIIIGIIVAIVRSCSGA